jgi:hypothetical protein
MVFCSSGMVMTHSRGAARTAGVAGVVIVVATAARDVDAVAPMVIDSGAVGAVVAVEVEATATGAVEVTATATGVVSICGVFDCSGFSLC